MDSRLLYLGTHDVSSLARHDVPLFISHRRLSKIKSMPVARTRWALDSGGFTELSTYGSWRTSTTSYIAAVRFYADEIGSLEWAAPQDWMCEPFMLQKTGLTVCQHQHRTVTNYLALCYAGAGLPFAPVLQGWAVDDYKRCWELYERAGVRLEDEPVVAVGSVCRRQHTDEAAEIFAALQPLRLHGFGVKVLGLQKFAHLLRSCDSMAWSLEAKLRPPLKGHEQIHKHCGNCEDYALAWRRRVIAKLP